MVHGDRDPGSAGAGHELGGFLDRLGSVVLRPPFPRAAAGAVHRRSRLAERDRVPRPAPRVAPATSATFPSRFMLPPCGFVEPAPGRRAPLREPEPRPRAGRDREIRRTRRTPADGDHRLESREDRRGRRAHAPQPGEEQRDRPDRRHDREAAQPAEAGRAHPSRVQIAAGQAGERQGGRRAGAHQRAQGERPQTRGDALRDQDVCGVDDRRPQPERRAQRVQRPRGGPRKDEHQAGRGEGQGDEGPAAGRLAPECDCGHRDHHRKGVDEQREQGGVETLQRREVAPGLSAVPDGAERERDADIPAWKRPQLRGRGPRTINDQPEQHGGEPKPRRPGACPQSRPRRRRACRRPPSRRRRPRRRGREVLRLAGMRTILPRILLRNDSDSLPKPSRFTCEWL